MAQHKRMFQPRRSCSPQPHKMQLLKASGISHLYLEREAALHANTWNHSERRSRAVTEGPFTPGWLHKPSLDGRWLIPSRLGRLPDLTTAATETTFAAGRLGHQLQLTDRHFAPSGTHEKKRWRQIRLEQRGSPTQRHTRARRGARSRLICVAFSALSMGASSSPLLSSPLLSSCTPGLHAEVVPSAGRCRTLMCRACLPLPWAFRPPRPRCP